MEISHSDIYLSRPKNIFIYNYRSPDVEHIRNEIEQSFWKQWKEGKPELNCLLIQKCIDRVIPLTRNDFGTWRFYNDCGKRQLKYAVKRLYDKEIEDAKNIINSKFIPHVIHQLYKYDGIMMKKTKEHFNENNKKNILNKKK